MVYIRDEDKAFRYAMFYKEIRKDKGLLKGSRSMQQSFAPRAMCNDSGYVLYEECKASVRKRGSGQRERRRHRREWGWGEEKKE